MAVPKFDLRFKSELKSEEQHLVVVASFNKLGCSLKTDRAVVTAAVKSDSDLGSESIRVNSV